MPEQACAKCGGSGLTGEQVYERISNEGGIWMDVLCECSVDPNDPIGPNRDAP